MTTCRVVGGDGELGDVGAVLDLGPGNRCGGAVASSRGVGGDSGLGGVVLGPVDEHPTGALALGPDRSGRVWGIAGQPLGELLAQADGACAGRWS